MADSMDTDALLDMSLDSLIAAKSKKSMTVSGKIGTSERSGKMRSSNRKDRRRQSAPYSTTNSSKVADSDSGKRVYVGNLAWSVTWKDLKSHMQQAGRVVKADVALEPGGRSKGYGIVEFQTAADARNAIDTLQDMDLMGRLIYLREDREAADFAAIGAARGDASNRMDNHGPPGKANCKVTVSNLPFEASWQDLKDHMRQAGNVLRADVIMRNDGRSAGTGTVEYSKPFEAKNAIAQLGETILRGRPILVREYRGNVGGYSNGAGRGIGGGIGTRVFVGNLSWQVAWQDLKDYMRQAGNVRFVDLFQEPGGRSKGCAVVEYETPDEAQIAIQELHDTELMGRLIFVREDRIEGSAASKSKGPMGARYPGAEGRQVYVGNLSGETDWPELKDHFKQAGHVEFVEIPEDSHGHVKGYATVRFANEQGASRAVEDLNGSELDGHSLIVQEDTM